MDDKKEGLLLPGSGKTALLLDSMESYQALFGMKDRHISIIESECHVKLLLNGSSVSISGSDTNVAFASDVIRILSDLIAHQNILDSQIIRFVINMVSEGMADSIPEALHTVIAITHRGG